MSVAIITGSSGLIGSEVAVHPAGDAFRHVDLDMRDRHGVEKLLQSYASEPPW